jgi:acyl-CoA synthetase (AMP-forming)/AMP-acid ligase II
MNSEYSKYAEALLINFAELHCCLVVPSVKEMLGRLCESINSHESCKMIILYYAATACMSIENKIKQNFLA